MTSFVVALVVMVAAFGGGVCALHTGHETTAILCLLTAITASATAVIAFAVHVAAQFWAVT